MEKVTFTQWLEREMTTAGCVLLKLYEEYDRLRVIEGPRIEGEYMEKVGEFEETVITEEIECEVLKKKQQMIQTAINRREPIDEAAINEEIAGYRETLMKEASGEEKPVSGNGGDSALLGALQKLYQEIVRNFHPQMHPELTEAQKLLFQKAQEAYRRKDKDALQLIYDMLQSTSKGDGELTSSMLKGLQFSVTEIRRTIVAEDYFLTAAIYHQFKPTSEEVVMEETLNRHKQAAEEVMQQMQQLREQFPYNAAKMLADPVQMEAYLNDLKLRIQNAQKERQQRTAEIQKMMERVKAYE